MDMLDSVWLCMIIIGYILGYRKKQPAAFKERIVLALMVYVPFFIGMYTVVPNRVYFYQHTYDFKIPDEATMQQVKNIADKAFLEENIVQILIENQLTKKISIERIKHCFSVRIITKPKLECYLDVDAGYVWKNGEAEKTISFIQEKLSLAISSKLWKLEDDIRNENIKKRKERNKAKREKQAQLENAQKI